VPASEAEVIDIGCGDGRLLDILASSCPKGWSLYGIDWSKEAIDRVKQKGYVGRDGDVSKIDLSDWQNKFDLAISHQLIEHVRDPREVLQKFASILRPGGIISIETPDIHSWDFKLLHDRYWSVYHIPRHFYIFSRENFIKLAEEVGLELVSVKPLVNPVAWIHSIQGYFADHKYLGPVFS